MSTVRIIVCGGREFSDKELCFSSLKEILAGYDDIEIISGHAKGADMFGEDKRFVISYSSPFRSI